LNAVYTTDTFFANENDLDGYKTAQRYCESKSYLTDVFGMKQESQMP